jgi:hypothetical protein
LLLVVGFQLPLYVHHVVVKTLHERLRVRKGVTKTWWILLRKIWMIWVSWQNHGKTIGIMGIMHDHFGGGEFHGIPHFHK